MLKITAPSNPNEAKIELNGKDVTADLRVRKLQVVVEVENPTTVLLEVMPDHVEIESEDVQITYVDQEK